MFRIYFKTALRNIFRDRVYSMINIAGLAIGLASFMLILFYLNHELSYDKWDPSLSRVYKISFKDNSGMDEGTPAPLANFIAERYPNAEAGTAFMNTGDYEIMIEGEGKKLYIKNMISADSSFLKVFPYQLKEGNLRTALDAPDAAVLSEELSEQIFGKSSPIGKTVKLFNSINCTVTGVLKTPAGPAHIPVNIIHRDPNEQSNKFWQNYSYQTFIKTKQVATEEQLDGQLSRIYYNDRVKKGSLSFEEYQKAEQSIKVLGEPIARLHNFPRFGSSNLVKFAVLTTLALMLLIAGAINFSNLTVAKSIRRAKEVGVRKVLGSQRAQLVSQFMLETSIQCLISLALAVLIILLTLPYFQSSFGINLNFGDNQQLIRIGVQILICLVIVIIVSGLYPSIFLAGYNLTKVLKGEYSRGRSGMLFRNALIVLQFIVAAFFITGSFIVKKQMNFMQEKDKGLSEKQVLRIQTSMQKTRDNGFETARASLLSIPGVELVSKTTRVPGDRMMDTSTKKFKYAGIEQQIASVKVSTDYFRTLNAQVLAGRLFNESVADQNTRSAVINETAAKQLGISALPAQPIYFPNCDTVPLEIIGIVKDFNVQGFENKVQPSLYSINNKACMFQSGGAVLVKMSSNRVRETVSNIEMAWKKIEPEFPIRYSFLDENFQKLFIEHERMQRIITFFAITAILISVVGLFALTAFLAGERTKEIGIRKVLGASITNLTKLLGKDFILLVCLAVLIASPIAWWAMNAWLDSFAYRITLSWWMLAIGASITATIAIITVSIQGVKAASANPVKSLRAE